VNRQLTCHRLLQVFVQWPRDLRSRLLRAGLPLQAQVPRTAVLRSWSEECRPHAYGGNYFMSEDFSQCLLAWSRLLLCSFYDIVCPSAVVAHKASFEPVTRSRYSQKLPSQFPDMKLPRSCMVPLLFFEFFSLSLWVEDASERLRSGKTNGRVPAACLICQILENAHEHSFLLQNT
jgi:hypothetical protein